MHFSRWAWFLVLVGCARVAVRQEPQNDSHCPRLGEVTQQLNQFGAATVQQACRSGDRCEDGPYVCRCEGPHGGAPRPPWWFCHRATGKADGCPDDAVLFAGAACTAPMQCRVPVTCGCSDFMEATCIGGRWVIPECRGMCMAP